MIELDHVLIAVTDLETAGRELETTHGLTAVEGGRHPGWGTANRIVPLGDTYLELIAVVDEAEAATSPFGAWVATRASALGRPLGWAVRTTDLDGAARRLGLTVGTGSRRVPDGGLLRWRGAGIEQAAADPCLPFFIEWGEGTPFPGRTAVAHRARPSGISRIELDGDAARLEGWLGGADLPFVMRPGPPAVRSVVVSAPAGEIVIGGTAKRSVA